MWRHYLKTFLPFVMIKLTGHHRYLPEIRWSDRSWTHNAFRLYEVLFWRRHGIRAEMYTESWFEDGKQRTVHYARSWEATIALAETYVRNALSYRPKFSRARVWIPVMQTPQGIPVFASPYIFAIALDAVDSDFTNQAVTNSVTISHTNTGSDLVVVGMVSALTGAGAVTGTTYATVAMSQFITADQGGDAGEAYIWGLPGPATGANNMVFSASGNIMARESAASYTGCKQSGQPDATGTNTAGFTDAAEVQVSATATVADTWGLMFSTNDRGTPVADTNATLRTSRAGAGYGFFDSAASLGAAGSKTMGWHVAGTGTNVECTVMALISPPAASAVKTWNGLAIASRKTHNGLASASVKTVDGLA